MEAVIAGYALGMSLILVIGPQNAFVLRQGLQRLHVLPVVLTCALSDAILIAAGVSGFGLLSDAVPWVADVMRWCGAAFLLAYGALSFRSAWTGSGALKAAGRSEGRALRAVATCLALTWLNPHVYLDTVLLFGTVTAAMETGRWPFAIGAMLASLTFFAALGYGARFLAPVFARPVAWRILDLVVGVLLWTIGVGLLIAG